MKNIIKINNSRIFAHHGCLPEETKIGANYSVNIELTCNFMEAAKTDDLTKTVDYVSINELIKTEMAKPSKLIEEVGFRILKNIQKNFPVVEKTKVEIIKHCPPINGDVESVSVNLEE